ncbi:MAG: hypothetical protein AAF533_29675 [Acidobacteriota bacterium]
MKRLKVPTSPKAAAALAIGLILAAGGVLHAAVGDVVTAGDDTTIGAVEARLEAHNTELEELDTAADELIDIAEEENEEVPGFSELALSIIEVELQHAMAGCQGTCTNPRLRVTAEHEGLLEMVLALVQKNIDNASFSGIDASAAQALLDDAVLAYDGGDANGAFTAACAAYHSIEVG